VAEASDYHNRVALEQATDERSFDLAATSLVQALAETVAQAARLLPQDEQGESRPWARDEAVLAAQVVRCSKLLRAYAQHFEQRQVEVCNYIGRGLMETTIDLRYLLHFGTPELLQKCVAHSFRSDLSLREEIETNIEGRDGVVLPIEGRLLSSMERRRDQAGVTLDEIPRSSGNTWGGSVRDKLRKLGREEMYQAAFGGPSAYTHGTWHELVIYHLRPAEDGDGYYPDTAFSDVRPQPADALTVLTTEAVGEYLAKQLPETQKREELLEQLVAMHQAALEIEELHENFLGSTGGPELAQ
jgi:hypothetical protein